MIIIATLNLYEIKAFDATTIKEFTFNWSGAQSFGNRLVILNNVTNATVYDQTQTTMLLKHTLPANTLTNGIAYNAVIYSIDSEGVSSTVSNKIIFKCLTTPTWNFTNISTNQIIKNSFIEATLNYSQIEGELLNSYQIELYNSSQSLVYKTEILYDSDLKATISGLNDNSQYYFRATGETLNGMKLDTGMIIISVEYTAPVLYSLVALENLRLKGEIKISYNVILVTGKSNPETPIYIDNSKVDVRENNRYVLFDEGFELQNDGIIQIVGQDFNDYSNICEWSNGTNKIELKYMRGTFASQGTEKAYFILKVYNSITKYTVYSNYINIPSDSQKIHIWIKRVNNVYDLKCEILS